MSDATIYDYKTPEEDLMHSLEVAGAGDLDEEAFGFTGEGVDGSALSDWLRIAGRIAEEKWVPTNREGDELDAVKLEANPEHEGFNHVLVPESFKVALKAHNDAGLAAPAASSEHGGMDMPWALSMSLREIFMSANMALSLNPTLGEGAIDALQEHGSEELKNLILDKMISGEFSGAMQLTEPDSGSDLATIKTKAAKQGDGTYHLEGDKIFITWGDHDSQSNIIHLVLAKTDPDAKGTKGISLFAVPKYRLDEDGNNIEHNGVNAESLHEKAGIHGSPTCVIKLGDGTPAVGYLVGDENEGMKHMLTMMNRARLAVARQGVAIAERAIQAATVYASQRPQGQNLDNGEHNTMIINHPDVQRMIMKSRAKIMAGRMICDYTGVQLDKSNAGDVRATQNLELFTSMAKAGCTDMGVDVTSTAMQIAGGFGYMKESSFPQHYNDARIAPIYEGTNGIQAMNLVMRQLFSRGEVPGERMMNWIEDTRKELTKDYIGDGDSHEICGKALQALNLLKEATEDILVMGANKQISEMASIATDYTTLFDRTAGAFFMSRSVNVAKAKGNPEFAEKHSAMASIYGQHVLPEADALANTLKSTQRDTLATGMKHYKL